MESKVSVVVQAGEPTYLDGHLKGTVSSQPLKRCYHHFYFVVDRKTGSKKLNHLPHATQVVKDHGDEVVREEAGKTENRSESLKCHNKKLNFILLAKQRH